MSDTTYLVTLGDRVINVQLRRSAKQVFVRIGDGEEQLASLEHIRGALYSLAIGERHTELLAASDPAEVRLAIGGVEYRAEVVDEAHARLAAVAGARATSHARRELRAPMPGLLVSVLSQPGQTVEPNQPLAVLRAMKMENELSLPRGGTVIAVNVEAGQTVEQGQVILVVE
jgi:biotin carboxyl carrier protein